MVVADLLDGRGREVLALPAPTKIAGRIGNLPHAAGLARPFPPHLILIVCPQYMSVPRAHGTRRARATRAFLLHLILTVCSLIVRQRTRPHARRGRPPVYVSPHFGTECMLLVLQCTLTRGSAAPRPPARHAARQAGAYTRPLFGST